MVELNQKFVIEQVTKFLEKGKNGYDRSFNIKWESEDSFIPACLLFLDARSKVEKRIQIWVPRGKKSLQVDSEGIGFEQKYTEPRKVRFRLSTKIVLPVLQKKFL